jgi:hypothetical protein
MAALRVVPGLVPGVHAVETKAPFEVLKRMTYQQCSQQRSIKLRLSGVDGRDKPGHD